MRKEDEKDKKSERRGIFDLKRPRRREDWREETEGKREKGTNIQTMAGPGWGYWAPPLAKKGIIIYFLTNWASPLRRRLYPPLHTDAHTKNKKTGMGCR